MAGLARCVRAPGPLAADEIAIRSGNRAGRRVVRAPPFAATHMLTTTRLSPFEAGGLEDSIETFAFGFTLGRRPNPAPPRAVTPDATCRPLIREAAARRSLMREFVQEPMNTPIDLGAGNQLPRFETHVVECRRDGRTLVRIYDLCGIGDSATNGDRVLGRHTPGHGGRHIADIHGFFAIEDGIGVAKQMPPLQLGLVEKLAFRVRSVARVGRQM